MTLLIACNPNLEDELENKFNKIFENMTKLYDKRIQ